MNIAIIFAGGVGQRLAQNADVIPKQFLNVNGRPVIVHTLELFQKHAEIDKIYIAILPQYKGHLLELVQHYNLTKTAAIVDGGETAQDSIYNALIKAGEENTANSLVLIHDGVRPIVDREVISRNIECAKQNGNAITCIPAYETTLVSPNGEYPVQIPFRKDIYTAQAPQTFVLEEIISAHETLRQRPEKYTNMIDACTIYHTLGRKTFMVRGNFGNIKVTTPEDLYILRALLSFREDKEAFGIKLST